MSEKKLWTWDERYELVNMVLTYEGSVEDAIKKTKKKLKRSTAACWIELARLASYGLVLAKIRNDIKKFEKILTKINLERGPDYTRILKQLPQLVKSL